MCVLVSLLLRFLVRVLTVSPKTLNPLLRASRFENQAEASWMKNVLNNESVTVRQVLDEKLVFFVDSWQAFERKPHVVRGFLHKL